MERDSAGGPADGGAPIDFARRFAGSQTFQALFHDGMALVEETAAYLDGPGRAASKQLDRTAALVYATESMRLTTRLMQAASWLLLQRAVNDGELTQAQAGHEKAKVRIDGPAGPRGGAGWDEVPRELKDLIDRSLRLQARVRRLDRVLSAANDGAAPAHNPVAAQLGRLASAFGGRGG